MKPSVEFSVGPIRVNGDPLTLNAIAFHHAPIEATGQTKLQLTVIGTPDGGDRGTDLFVIDSNGNISVEPVDR